MWIFGRLCHSDCTAATHTLILPTVTRKAHTMYWTKAADVSGKFLAGKHNKCESTEYFGASPATIVSFLCAQRGKEFWVFCCWMVESHDTLPKIILQGSVDVGSA